MKLLHHNIMHFAVPTSHVPLHEYWLYVLLGIFIDESHPQNAQFELWYRIIVYRLFMMMNLSEGFL